jgi:hypothetical protein
VAGTIAALTKTISSTRTFEVLNAQLITATGSAENAATAFKVLQDFASNTPYDLAQVTDSFTKLVNLGLTPSERALTSYGDTASAMGKDLNQLIEAVADAATGEFERLKEFGIRASKQGDEVSFTFRGVTDTVAFNSAEIESYLMKLGENNFAGAMAARMATLDGAISNLGDEWEKLWMTVGQAGVGDLVETQVHRATDALSDMTAMVASKQLAGYVDALGNRFLRVADDVITMVEINDTAVTGWLDKWVTDTDDAMDILKSSFFEFPENVKAMLDLAYVEFQAFDKKMGVVEDLILDHLDFTTFWKDPLRIGPGAAYDKAMTTIADGRTAAIATVLKEREASLNAFNADISAADAARAAYDKAQAARAGLSGDALAPFKIEPGSGDSGGSDGAVTAIDKKIAKLQDEADMAWAVGTQLEMLKLHSEGASDAQIMLAQNAYATIDAMAALDAELSAQADTNEAAAGIAASLKSEEDQITASYQRRREIILDSTRMSEDERHTVLKDLEAQYQEDLLTANDSYWAKWLQGAELALTDFKELAGSTIEAFSTGFGNAFESVILDSQSTDEALKGLLRSLLRGTVNSLGQMTAQWLAFQALKMAGITAETGAVVAAEATKATASVAATTTAATASVAATTTTTTAQVAAAATTATAWLPAALVASIGSFGAAAVVGGAALIAAYALIGGFKEGGYTGDASENAIAGVVHGKEFVVDADTTRRIGVSNLMQMTGMAHDGIDKVPREGTWLLGKGERVTGAPLNQDLTTFLQRENTKARQEEAPTKQSGNGAATRGGDMNPTVVMQLTAGVPEAVRQEIVRLMPQITTAALSAMRQAISEGGDMARAVGRK